jgi:hypothetical protein
VSSSAKGDTAIAHPENVAEERREEMDRLLGGPEVRAARLTALDKVSTTLEKVKVKGHLHAQKALTYSIRATCGEWESISQAHDEEQERHAARAELVGPRKPLEGKPTPSADPGSSLGTSGPTAEAKKGLSRQQGHETGIREVHEVGDREHITAPPSPSPSEQRRAPGKREQEEEGESQSLATEVEERKGRPVGAARGPRGVSRPSSPSREDAEARAWAAEEEVVAAVSCGSRRVAPEMSCSDGRRISRCMQPTSGTGHKFTPWTAEADAGTRARAAKVRKQGSVYAAIEPVLISTASQAQAHVLSQLSQNLKQGRLERQAEPTGPEKPEARGAVSCDSAALEHATPCFDARCMYACIFVWKLQSLSVATSQPAPSAAPAPEEKSQPISDVLAASSKVHNDGIVRELAVLCLTPFHLRRQVRFQTFEPKGAEARSAEAAPAHHQPPVRVDPFNSVSSTLACIAPSMPGKDQLAEAPVEPLPRRVVHQAILTIEDKGPEVSYALWLSLGRTRLWSDVCACAYTAPSGASGDSAHRAYRHHSCGWSAQGAHGPVQGDV